MDGYRSIKQLLSEADRLNEGLNWVDGRLELGDLSDDASALIPVKLGRNTKSLSTTKRIPYYKAYQFNKHFDKDTVNDAKYAIKSMDPSLVDPAALDYMINKAVMNFSQLVGGINSYDVILAPRSSGKLNKALLKALHAKMRRDVPIYTDALVKRAADNLVLDMDTLTHKFDDSARKNFYKKLDYAITASGELKIRLVPTRFRDLVLQMLKLDPSKEAEIISKIVGKRVLVVDDITTKGTTLFSASNLLLDLGAEEVHGFILLKSDKD